LSLGFHHLSVNDVVAKSEELPGREIDQSAPDNTSTATLTNDLPRRPIAGGGSAASVPTVIFTHKPQRGIEMALVLGRCRCGWHIRNHQGDQQPNYPTTSRFSQYPFSSTFPVPQEQTEGRLPAQRLVDPHN